MNIDLFVMDSSDVPETALLRKPDNLIADGNYEKAIICLDRILEGNPDHNEALSMKGLAYCLKGDTEKGISILENALKLDPFSKTVLITFADACLRSSMPEKSLEILERAISYYPEDDGFVMLKKVIITAVRRHTENLYFN